MRFITKLCAIVAGVGSPILAVQAQGFTDDQVASVYAQAEPCVVSLVVDGTFQGQDVRAQGGVGAIIKTGSGPRILTAGHVVGADAQFDLKPGEATQRLRDIVVRIRGPYGPSQIGPLHAAQVSPSYDVAEVFLDSTTNGCLLMSSKEPVVGQSLLAVSWPGADARSSPIEVRVLPRVASDGPLLRVDHEFVEGQSGSPVLDSTGLVAGILLVRNRQPGGAPYTLMLPVAEFRSFIPDATVVDKSTVREAVWVADSPISVLPAPLHCGCVDIEMKTADIWEPVTMPQQLPPGTLLRFTSHCPSTMKMFAVKDTLTALPAATSGGPFAQARNGPFAQGPPGFTPVGPTTKLPGREFAVETLAPKDVVIFDMKGATGSYFQSVSCSVNPN